MKRGKIILSLSCLVMMFFTISANAQNKGKDITLNVNRMNLPKALTEVEKQSGYYKINFNYDEMCQYTVSAVIKNKKAKEAVDILLGRLPFSCSVNGKYITVKKEQGVNNLQNSHMDEKKGVSGTVTDENGEPLLGATIVVQGTARGAVTDEQGHFNIPNAKPDEQIVISYIGKKTLRRKASNKDMNIIIDADSHSLDDVVVVGYGNMHRRDLTGSVSTVDPEDLTKQPSLTLDDALTGKVAGMQVVKADGSPGGAVRIRVRGGSSIQGAVDPLYIIDGIPTEVTNNFISQTDVVNPIEAQNYGEDFGNSISGSFARGLNSLAGLNINDIESISILKDASATAIYGSKGANGVVIITTKRGQKDQKPKIEVSSSLNFSSPIKEKVLTGDQYIDALEKSLNTSTAQLKANGMDDQYDNSKLLAQVESMKKINANTNWLNLVLRTGVSHNIDGSISGGSQKSRYYASIAYARQEGTIIGTDFNRYTAKLNLDTDVSLKFRTGINANFSNSKTNITSGVYGQALSAPPVLPAYNADGSYADYSAIPSVANSYMGFQNPLAVASITNRANNFQASGSVYGEYDIIKDLKFKSVLSASYINYNQLNYIPSYVNVSGYYGSENSNGGTGSQSQSTTTNVFWENTLTWNKTFNDIHRINAVIGHSWEQDQENFFSAAGSGYPDDTYLNNLSSAMTPTKVQGATPSAQTSLLSFYTRLNYSLMDRYMLTFTGRSDASSKFSKAHRTGYFPSGAIAWRISEEPFLKNVKWIDEIKLRGSVGKTGTQRISNWMFLTLYSVGSYAGKNAVYPSQLGNDDIKWESTNEQDLGLDFSLFGNRLGGVINYYHKVTDGALLNITPAPSSGYMTVVSNVAKVENRGIELELHTDIIRNTDWTWSADMNISHNASKVLNIYGDMFSNSTDRNELDLGTSIIKEGKSLGQLYGYKAVGVIKTQGQLDDYKNRFQMWSYLSPDLGIGSVELALDKDGQYYKDVIGNSTPDFYGGFDTSLRWKNWGLTANFTFSYGNDLIYQKDVTDMGVSSLTNHGVKVLDASTVENITDRPISSYRNWYTLTNLNVYDASYLKLQTLSLSYNVPRSVLQHLNITSAIIYATAGNIFTITKYPGPDPAVSDDPYSISGGGRDASTYPTVKSYSLGVRIGF